MEFTDIIGQNHIKKHLQYSADHGRIAHAQLFVAKPGTGALEMAIAYAQYLIYQLQTKSNIKKNPKDYSLQHPDLHFVFPVASTAAKKSSDSYFDEWISFLEEETYGNYPDWLTKMDVKNQQPIISVKESEAITKKLSLKSFEGGYKVMIIWMVEKMNTEASNKLLKLLEEPPKKTVFILITESEDQILDTIKSRCQTIHFNALAEADIAKALQEKYGVEESKAMTIAKFSNGNFRKAIELLEEREDNKVFDEWFVQWVRAAFLANKNARVISKLLRWSETIADIGRENQKMFLEHCLEIFRQAFLLNYGTKELIFFQSKDPSFSLEKFAPFITNKNIHGIYEAINDSIYHIERNGNAKIIFSDLSIQLTRLIHKK